MSGAGSTRRSMTGPTMDMCLNSTRSLLTIATWNNMKLVHWPLMGGLHLVQQWGAWAGGAKSPPHCTKCIPYTKCTNLSKLTLALRDDGCPSVRLSVCLFVCRLFFPNAVWTETRVSPKKLSNLELTVSIDDHRKSSPACAPIMTLSDSKPRPVPHSDPLSKTLSPWNVC